MTKSRKVQVLSPIQVDTGWYFRSYLIQAEADEAVAIEVYTNRLFSLVTEIERTQLSNEFDYFKVGFIVGHFGKRGICVSIWHWGKWLTSYELFNQCWYTYGRDVQTLSLLDRKEPICCQFDVPILIKEFEFFHAIATAGFESHERDARDAFMRYSPRL